MSVNTHVYIYTILWWCDIYICIQRSKLKHIVIAYFPHLFVYFGQMVCLWSDRLAGELYWPYDWNRCNNAVVTISLTWSYLGQLHAIVLEQYYCAVCTILCINYRFIYIVTHEDHYHKTFMCLKLYLEYKSHHVIESWAFFSSSRWKWYKWYLSSSLMKCKISNCSCSLNFKLKFKISRLKD